MKAARIHEFGGPEVVRVEEVDRPRPGEKQLLLRVGASSLNHIDLSLRAGEMRLLTQFQLPKTLGFDVAGEVVECGAEVTSFLVGERVVAMTGMAAGTAAEYCTVDQGKAAHLPDGIGFADGAALPLAGATALQALRGIAHLRENQRVLVNGASGGVGGYGVQLAKLLGAHVTAVCRAVHFEYVQGLGADALVDYQSEDVVQAGHKFDVVFDAAAKLDVEGMKALAHPGAHVITTRPETKRVIESVLERLRGSVKIHFMLTKPRPGDLALLLRLLGERRLRPCIARTFPLAEAAEAQRYLEQESVAGKVLLLPAG